MGGPRADPALLVDVVQRPAGRCDFPGLYTANVPDEGFVGKGERGRGIGQGAGEGRGKAGREVEKGKRERDSPARPWDCRHIREAAVSGVWAHRSATVCLKTCVARHPRPGPHGPGPYGMAVVAAPGPAASAVAPQSPAPAPAALGCATPRAQQPALSCPALPCGACTTAAGGARLRGRLAAVNHHPPPHTHRSYQLAG